MTIAALQRSLAGIKKEIHNRDQILRHLATWYGHCRNRRSRSNSAYTLRYFYFQGPKVLREMNVLQSICADIEKIIARRLEETPW